jgi:hypothetical protein
MLIGNQRFNRYAWLRSEEEVLILAFLQGAVYAWCNQHHDAPFAARHFVGLDNRVWQGTPLIILYNHYRNLHPNRSNRYAINQAGRALGHLLKRVIVEDKRLFTTDVRARVRHYSCIWPPQDRQDHTPIWQRVFFERLGA